MGRSINAAVRVSLQSASPVGFVGPARNMLLRESRSEAGRPGAQMMAAPMAGEDVLS